MFDRYLIVINHVDQCFLYISLPYNSNDFDRTLAKPVESSSQPQKKKEKYIYIYIICLIKVIHDLVLGKKLPSIIYLFSYRLMIKFNLII